MTLSGDLVSLPPLSGPFPTQDLLQGEQEVGVGWANIHTTVINTSANQAWVV